MAAYFAGGVKTLTRFLKYGSVVGVSGVSLYFMHRNQYDLSSIGLMRLGRAATACSFIFMDYKLSLWRLDSESLDYSSKISEVHSRSATRLLHLACSNGGVWIKVGQHIATLDYLLPREYVQTMRVLHANAPESSSVDIKSVVFEELNKQPSELFARFDDVPIGAASLAQVHKAVLHSGETVAVKVQHPRVKAHSLVDIATMEGLVMIATFLFPNFRFKWLSEEMKKNLPVELDFINEGKNAEQINRMFSHLEFLKIPKIYWSLSTDRVLTMEYCEGGQVDNLNFYEDNDIDTRTVCRMLGKLYSEMIFLHGYVHCDPHPGNVLVHKDPKFGLQLVLLDHGLYTTLTDEFRMSYSNLWLSLMNTDMNGVKKYATELGVGKLYPLFVCMLTARSWNAVNSGITKQTVVTKEENDDIKANVANYIPQITEVLDLVPRPMLLILKTNDTLRGIEYTLKTNRNAYSFIEMSKCCVKAVSAVQIMKSNNFVLTATIWCRQYLQLSGILVYEWWLAFRDLIGYPIYN